MQRWYRQYQEGSPLTCSSWEKFHDPRETTYAKYTDLQMDKEIFVDSLLEEIESTGYDQQLPAPWVKTLSNVVAPLRYPVHGLEMIAAYIGQMAPSGKIAITAALQSADEVRRVERLAQRVRQLQMVHAGFGADSREIWQRNPLWQPLRENIFFSVGDQSRDFASGILLRPVSARHGPGNSSAAQPFIPRG